MNKRGISAVVATVLIILITVSAVTIVWTAIIPMIRDNLEMGTVCLEADVSVSASGGWTCYDSSKKILAIQVAKGPNEIDIPKVHILMDNEGTSSTVVRPASFNYNSKKMFYMLFDDAPDEVGVAPVISIGSKEKVCDVGPMVKLSDCTITSTRANLDLEVPGSLINSDSWEVGFGSAPGYGKNGADSENEREYGIGPYGDSVLLWKAIPAPAPSDRSNGGSDGGWDSGWVDIDHTKPYRFTIWLKRTGDIGGTSYFGTRSGNGNITYLDGTVINNSYFWSGDLPEFDKWYFLVGYIHGSGDNSMTGYGGLYDGESGEKVLAFDRTGSNSRSDFKFKTSAIKARHRSYLYYNSFPTDNRQYFWNPTFTEVSDYNLPIEIQ